MKQFLLSTLFASATLGLAATPIGSNLQTVKVSDNITVTSIKNTAQTDAKRLAKGVTLRESNGIKKIYRLAENQDNRLSVNSKRVAKAQVPEGYVLFESFEDWDGEDLSWTPEGWTVDMRGDVELKESWTPAIAMPNYGLPAAADGKYYYGINFSMGNQDEWLISPEVEISEGFNLSYWLYLEPLFLFNLGDGKADWDAIEFIGDPEVSATLQIWAQAEGEEWTMLHDYFDDYKDMSMMELYMLSGSSNMEKKTISLNEFAGKKIKVAFRYLGTDGNTMFVDAIGIGYPALEDISYMNPFETLYWGFNRDWQLSALQADIAMYPVYYPLTWTNTSYIDDAEFSWTYCDPKTSEFVTSNEQDELVVTYEPDYSSESSMRNNFFYPPILNASAPNATPGSYQAPYTYFQAGGKFERPLNNGTVFEGTLLPFGVNASGITMVTCDDETIGDPAIPVFGYNANTNQYWLNYSLNGEEKIDGDYSRLEGIANLFWASKAPIVVNGITAYGWGKVNPDAEFTATIYGVNSEYSTEYESLTKIASATLKGSQFIAEYDDDKGYLCLPFDFEKPVVIAATEEHPAYFIMLEGFNSDKVEYFVPLQSAIDDPNYICNGYILNHIDLSAHTGRPAYYSMKPMVYKEYGEYVDFYGSFAIGLDAEYPWLTTDATEIELPSNGSPVEVQLGSYYDGSKLTVEVPAGVEATVAGRYNKCVLTLKHNEADVIAEGNVVVKGPGVEISIPVKEVVAGISDINKDNNIEIIGIYDLNGRCVSAEDAKSGIYVVKYSDGSVSKTVIK